MVNSVSRPIEVVSSTDTRVPSAGLNFGNSKLFVQSVNEDETGVDVVRGPKMVALAVKQEHDISARAIVDLHNKFIGLEPLRVRDVRYPERVKFITVV
jgi:hypothetical protein